MKFPRVVYAIKHEPTGKIYVGSTSDLLERMKSHFNPLKGGYHSNEAMQADCNQYGFSYSVFALDTIHGMEDKGKELLWMAALNTRDPEHGYNGKDPSLVLDVARFDGFLISDREWLTDDFRKWLKK